MVGPTGVPEAAPGFGLIAADPDGAGSGTDLLVGFGRAYVGGILVEHDRPAPTVLIRVSGAPGNFLVASGPVPAVGQWLVAPAGAGFAPARVTAIPAPFAADGGRTRRRPRPGAGRRHRHAVPRREPARPAGSRWHVDPRCRRHLRYREVVEREVTALDDPLLRETALGGPDTCLRTQVVWRVRSVAGATCHDFAAGWRPDPAARARLAA